MFVIHKTLPNKKKLKNNAMPIYKISSSLIWLWFFPERKILNPKKCLKTHFLNGISSKSFKFLDFSRFN
jgi:hypothetical protein